MGFSSVKKEVTILSGAAVSDAINTTNFFYLAALIMPLITTSTAITFTVSDDGVTYVPLHDGVGAVYDVVIDNTAVNAIALDPAIFYPWTYIKINVADNQGADRIIKAIVRGY